MINYKVGDKLRSEKSWDAYGIYAGDIVTVTQVNGLGLYAIDKGTGGNTWGLYDFTLLDHKEPKFIEDEKYKELFE